MVEPDMEILVLGGAGMLGHKMVQRLGQRFPGTYCTIHGSGTSKAERKFCDFQNGRVVERFDATDFASLERFLLQKRPRVIVNCIGIIKQRAAAKDAVASITVNSLLPHKLAEICRQWGGRLIHFSTDCVFSGNRGGYREEDFADAEDLYGRTKFLGEVIASNSLTLRTSIIGRELRYFTSLLEWFLSKNHGKVKGYKKAIYSGVTTNWLAMVVGDLIEAHPDLSGLFQIAGPTISKFDLLCVLREAYELDIDIEPDDEFWCDRSMVGEKFARMTGYACPPWPELAAQLAEDATPYVSTGGIEHENIRR